MGTRRVKVTNDELVEGWKSLLFKDGKVIDVGPNSEGALFHCFPVIEDYEN